MNLKSIINEDFGIEPPGVNPVSLPKSSRINLYPESNVPPTLRPMVANFDKILDKKYKAGMKVFTHAYINGLVDDLVEIYVPPNVMKDPHFMSLVKDYMVKYAEADYDVKG